MALQDTRRLSLRTPFRLRAAAAVQAVRGVPGHLWRWYVARQTRLALARLDDRLLADIGVSREQASDEATQPYWRVDGSLPRDWRS